MRIRFFYFLKEALSSFSKNWVMSLAAISTVAISLLIVGTFLFFAHTMNDIIQAMEQKVEIVAYLKDAAPPEAVEALQQEVFAWSEVKEVSYVSKDQALERLKEDLRDQPEMLQAMQGNPLPASLEIGLEDPHQVKEVAERLKNRPELDDIRYGQQYIDRLFAVTRVVRWVGLIFVALLSFASLVLIANTIRIAIYARRKEVAIMRLVGASNWFIRWPFLFEGIIQGVIGAIIAIGLIYIAKVSLVGRASDIVPFLSISLDSAFFLRLALGLIMSGVIIGVSGSAVALRRFLKV